MVIAASLSQVQNLLQHDALREKPQLLETFDRALTGCRVVYGCLEEEVRELRVKAENDDLKFKDRARFPWKEDTFRELLTQIRGQQSALSLLIQGLQMESIADIKKLVEDNSVTLDQVVKRSRTLRQSHPRLKVPESLFGRRSLGDEGVDTDSIAKATEFAFDDEVVNSKAYRRAMAMALSSPNNGAIAPESSHTDILEDYSTALGSISEADDKNKIVNAIDLHPPSAEEEKTITSVLQPEAEQELTSQVATKDDHADLFDTLERDILSFMPQTSSTALCLTPNHTSSKNASPLPSQPTDPLTPDHTGSEKFDRATNFAEAAVTCAQIFPPCFE
ncbi:hypothetical protein ACET3X_008624 [Alternaria dauci]|uniref:Uncharacterized protein n=1 Tax=Alternaria dauci TaxID=48095 RepID=A0ABR3UAX2_9PLEO